MRVLLVAHGYPPAGRGGTEIYVEALARSLVGLGQEVFVLAREVDSELPEWSVRSEGRDGVEVRWLNQTFARSTGFASSYLEPGVRAQAARQIEAIAPDIAHVHHLTCLSADLLAELARRQVPTVLTLHDYWMICHRGQLLDLDLARCEGPLPDGCARCLWTPVPATAPGAVAVGVGRSLARRFPRVLAAMRRAASRGAPAGDGGRRATLERARVMQSLLALPDRLLAPSGAIAERFERFGVAPERLQLHELGIDLQPFSRITRTVGRVDTGPGRPLRLGFLGSLMVSKAPHLLLEAAARLPPGTVEVELYGALTGYHGDDGYSRRLEPLLAFPWVRRRVVEHREVPAALATLDALVVPSIWPENSPLVVREAFAAGLPVIGSAIGGIPEVVRDGISGLLFEPGDAAQLERCLRRLLDEPSLLPHLRAGLPAVRSIEDDAAQTLGIYRELERAPGRRQRLAAVVLDYRTPQDAALAVRALQSSSRPLDDLVVIENDERGASAAALRDLVPGVEVVSPARNLGFAGGMNAGMELVQSRGADLVLIQNADVLLAPTALARLEAALLEDAGAGLAGPAVLARSSPGVIDSLGLSYSRRTGRFQCRHAGESYDARQASTVRVPALAASALLVRSQVLAAVGGFAEELFFGFEDLDLCLRAQRAGFASLCVGAARAYHEGGGALSPRDPRRQYYATRNHLLVARRSGAPAGGLATTGRAALVLALNLAHALFRAPSPRPRGLVAVLQGARDHLRGRYGPAG